MTEKINQENVLPDSQDKKPVAWASALTPLTFKGKAVLFLVPTIIIMSLVYTLAAIQGENKILRAEIINKGETIAAIAAKNAELPVLSENREQLEHSALSLMEIKDVTFASFFNKRFKLLFHKGTAHVDAPSKDLKPESGVSFVEHGNLFEFIAPVFVVRTRNDIFFFQNKSSSSPPLREHIGWVRIGLSKKVMTRYERQIMVQGIVLAVLFTSIGVFLVYIFISLATRPLNTLFNAVQGVRAGAYPEVQVSSPKSEIGRLSAEFNRMSRAIKEREEKVVASERRIKDLFERVEHAIFRLDKTGAIIETNKKFDEYCGGIKDFHALFQGDIGMLHLGNIASGALRSSEEKIIGKDGNELIVSMSVYPDVDGHDTLTGFDGYFIDITEKKRLEERLAQSQKMESVGLLAGGVSHDFNNLLTPILGYTDLLLAKLPPDDEQTKPLKIVRQAACRARDLTRQLLAFSRKQILELKTVNLGQIINSFENMLRRTIRENISIEVRIAPDLGLVRADTGQIEQVLLNLSINAQDAMQEGGTLSIEAKDIMLDESYTSKQPEVIPGPYVMLSVSDTGIGMDEETRAHIFEPFFTTKELGRGTGLGLSTVYGIVKQHGGSISVYSEKGRGTIFKVYLPRALEQGAAIEKRQPFLEELARGIETILVVEDNDMVRELTCNMLADLGYQVLAAENPERCIELASAQKHSFHLLLTDVVMPKMNGVDLFGTLHRMRPGLKVLFMSGYASDVIGRHGVLDEKVNFIQKPFSLHALSQKVRHALDS